MTDPHVLKARTAAEQYKALNTETVEKLSVYDPERRCWIFKKVQIDPRAKEFKRPEVLIRKKEKPKKKKLKPVNDTPRPARKLPPKPKKQSAPKVYTPKVNPNQAAALELAKSGKSVPQIAEILNVTFYSVYRYLKKEGFKVPKKEYTPNERYQTVKAMLEKGMKPHEIKKATGMKSMVHYYINEIKKNEKWT